VSKWKVRHADRRARISTRPGGPVRFCNVGGRTCEVEPIRRRLLIKATRRTCEVEPIRRRLLIKATRRTCEVEPIAGWRSYDIMCASCVARGPWAPVACGGNTISATSVRNGHHPDNTVLYPIGHQHHLAQCASSLLDMIVNISITQPSNSLKYFH
jgi:hypothetical protein